MSQPATTTIHLSNIVHNWKALSALHPGAEASAVVKADGYGHGAGEVASALQAAGCQSFFVATIAEAVDLRLRIGEGSDIFVLNGMTDNDVEAINFNALTPVLNTLDQIRIYRAASLKEMTPACLHFDTGMNRLGLAPEDAKAALTMLDGRRVGWVMSHLACADAPENAMNREQKARFDQLSTAFPQAVKSLSATAACYLGDGYGYDMIRPGIGIYGGGPASPAAPALKPGMTLKAPILATFMAQDGETVGYGAAYTLHGERRLATVAIGYADGLPRALANKGFGYIDKQRVPIVGRISMDLISLDVSNVTSPIAPGVMVEFIGAKANLEAQAAAAGTLGYELITGLGQRVERIYED